MEKIIIIYKFQSIGAPPFIQLKSYKGIQEKKNVYVANDLDF